MPIPKELNRYHKLILSISFEEKDVKGVLVTKAHGLLIDVQHNNPHTPPAAQWILSNI